MGSPSTFRQNDLTRAIRAAKAAGMRPRVIIDRRGVIEIVEDRGDAALTPPPVAESVDRADEAACDDTFG